MTGGMLMSGQQHVLDVQKHAAMHIRDVVSPLPERKAKADEANQAQNSDTDLHFICGAKETDECEHKYTSAGIRMY